MLVCKLQQGEGSDSETTEDRQGCNGDLPFREGGSAGSAECTSCTEPTKICHLPPPADPLRPVAPEALEPPEVFPALAPEVSCCPLSVPTPEPPPCWLFFGFVGL